MRNYSSDGIKPDMEVKIKQILAHHTTGPMMNRVTFHLVNRKLAKDQQGVKLGTYGFIKGAQHFIAGEVGKGPYAEEDYGYLLEKIILRFVELELGTCWLGGTFKRSDFANIIMTSRGAVIPAITPVGHAAPSMSNREQMIRKGAKSDQRKPWKELFFDGDFSKPLTSEAAEESSRPLEMIRLAPSASNKQPWRVVRKENVFHFLMSKTLGYGSVFKGIDLQRIDMGIAMAHFDLSCREIGLDGGWNVADHGIRLPHGLHYIISWVHKPE